MSSHETEPKQRALIIAPELEPLIETGEIAEFYPFHDANLDEDGVNVNQTPPNPDPVYRQLGIKTTTYDEGDLIYTGVPLPPRSVRFRTSKTASKTKPFRFKDGPIQNRLSDFTFQDIGFTKLVKPDFHIDRNLKYVQNNGNIPGLVESEKVAKERAAITEDMDDADFVALFVVDYLHNAGLDSDIDPLKLAESIRRGDENPELKKLVKKFNEELSNVGTRAHMVYEMRKGKDVTTSLDDPSSSIIPVAVQRRAKILRHKRKHERWRKKGGKLQNARFEENAEISYYSGLIFTFGKEGAATKKMHNARDARQKKLEGFKNHRHHIDHKFKELAFGKNQIDITKHIPGLDKQISIGKMGSIPAKKLEKAAKKLIRAVNPVIDNEAEPNGLQLLLKSRQTDKKHEDSHGESSKRTDTASHSKPPERRHLSLVHSRESSANEDALARQRVVAQLLAEAALLEEEEKQKKAA